MSKLMDRGVRAQTLGEEVFNAVSHGVGACLSVVGMVLMILRSVQQGSGKMVFCSVLYGAALLLLYVMSTLYHSFPQGRAKRVLRVMDHISIYVLIAGTYTPFTLITLAGPLGYTLFAVIWALALLNIVLNAVSLDRFRKWSMICYAGMGWLCVIAMPAIVREVGMGGMALLLGGGIAYTVGIVFYSRKRVYFAHCLWHLFVLGGSVLHFFATYSYVMR